MSFSGHLAADSDVSTSGLLAPSRRGAGSRALPTRKFIELGWDMPDTKFLRAALARDGRQEGPFGRRHLPRPRPRPTMGRGQHPGPSLS